jgi:translation elongation factor EF-Tu-like GTPase
MRARIKKAFAITGRGTALVLDLLEGPLRRGDIVSCPKNDGTLSDLIVGGVEFVDRIAEKQADIGILVNGIDPAEVQIGREITASGPQ